MPRYRKRRKLGFKRYVKRRGYGRRNTRKSRGRRITTVREKSLLTPDRRFVKISTTRKGVITAPIVGLFASAIVAGNSIYDTIVTAGTSGLQRPIGFNEWYAFYKYVVVLASKITATFINPNDNQWYEVSLRPSSDDASTSNVATGDADLPYYRYKILGPSQGNAGVRSVKHYMNSKKMFGQKDITGDDAFYESQSGALSSWYRWNWIIGVQNITSTGTTVSNIPVRWNIKYYCMFTNMKKLPTSDA